MNENGLLSFLTDIPSFFNVQFPLDYPLIAGLYSDVDTRFSGMIWYGNTSDEAILRRAKETVQRGFGNVRFEPEEVFMATWEGVGYYEKKEDKVSAKINPFV